jgi:hypothetical protein
VSLSPGHGAVVPVPALTIGPYTSTVVPVGASTLSPTIDYVVVEISGIEPPGIPSTATVGTPTLIPTLIITPPSVTSTATVGVASVVMVIAPSGIPSTAAVGICTISTVSINPEGTASTATVGTPTLLTIIPALLNVIDADDLNAAPTPVRNRAKTKMVEFKSAGVYSLERGPNGQVIGFKF